MRVCVRACVCVCVVVRGGEVALVNKADDEMEEVHSCRGMCVVTKREETVLCVHVLWVFGVPCVPCERRSTYILNST